MQLRSFFLLLFVSISMMACGPDYLFQQRIEIPNQEWTYEQIADFEIEVKDTLELYNLILEIEHSVNYSKQNIYVKIHTEFPSGEKLSKQIPINFADKGGQWYGDCGSEWCTLLVNIQQGAFFNEAGNYTFSFEQFMRINPLPGIKALTYKVEKTGMRRE